MKKKHVSRIVEDWHDGMLEIVKQPETKKLVDKEAFQAKYKFLIDDFYQALVEQYLKDEKVFPAGQAELVNLKLSQITPEIERLEKSFSAKTKYGMDKIDRYSPDEIALYGYKKFELWLKGKLIQPEINSPKRVDISKIFKPGYADLFQELLVDSGGWDEIKNLPILKSGDKKAGILFGIIKALQQNKPLVFISDYQDQQLLDLFNSYLGTNYKWPKKSHGKEKEVLDSANRYIKRYSPTK